VQLLHCHENWVHVQVVELLDQLFLLGLREWLNCCDEANPVEVVLLLPNHVVESSEEESGIMEALLNHILTGLLVFLNRVG